MDNLGLNMVNTRTTGGGLGGSSRSRGYKRIFHTLDPATSSHYELEKPWTPSGDFEVEVSFSTTDATSNMALVADDHTNALFLHLPSGATDSLQFWDVNGNVTISFGDKGIDPRDGNLHTLKVNRTGDVYTFTADGVELGTWTRVNSYKGENNFLIGRGRSVTAPFNGTIANVHLRDLENPENSLFFALDEAELDYELPEITTDNVTTTSDGVLGQELALISEHEFEVGSGLTYEPITNNLVAGKTYLVSFELYDFSVYDASNQGDGSGLSGSGHTSGGFYPMGDATLKKVVVSNGSYLRIFAHTHGLTSKFRNISVKEIPNALQYQNVTDRELFTQNVLTKAITRVDHVLDPSISSHYELESAWIPEGDFEVELDFATTALGSNMGLVNGDTSDNNIYVLFQSAGTINFSSSYQVEIDGNQIPRLSDVTQYLDGEFHTLKISGSTTTAKVANIGKEWNGNPFNGTIRNVKLIDLQNTTNSRFFALNEATKDYEVAQVPNVEERTVHDLDPALSSHYELAEAWIPSGDFEIELDFATTTLNNDLTFFSGANAFYNTLISRVNSSGNVVAFAYVGGAVSDNTVTTGENYADGEFHHLRIEVVAGIAKLYLDGEFKDSATWALSGNEDIKYIGVRGNSSQDFNGSIKNVKLIDLQNTLNSRFFALDEEAQDYELAQVWNGTQFVKPDVEAGRVIYHNITERYLWSGDYPEFWTYKLGQELVVNGDFSEGSEGWLITDPRWTFGDGYIQNTGASTNFNQEIAALEQGKTYRIDVDVLELNSPSMWLELASAIGSHGQKRAITTSGKHTVFIYISNRVHQRLYVYGGNLQCKIGSISIREIPNALAYHNITERNEVKVPAVYEWLGEELVTQDVWENPYMVQSSWSFADNAWSIVDLSISDALSPLPLSNLPNILRATGYAEIINGRVSMANVGFGTGQFAIETTGEYSIDLNLTHPDFQGAYPLYKRAFSPTTATIHKPSWKKLLKVN